MSLIPLEDWSPKPCIAGTCLFAEYALDRREDVLYLLVKSKGEQTYSSSSVFPAKVSGPAIIKSCKRLCWFWLG